jgi:hypothetical protein
MAYFNKFPLITYRGVRIRDITRRTTIFDAAKEVGALFDDYIVVDGETPDILAAKYYGDARYNWVILQANNIIDPFYDWPLGVREFNRFVLDKYGAENLYSIKHYVTNEKSVDGEGIIVSEGYTPQTHRDAVTNYEYEQALNDDKRRIKLLRREFVTQVEQEFARKIGD